jgi:hypothetical protein
MIKEMTPLAADRTETAPAAASDYDPKDPRYLIRWVQIYLEDTPDQKIVPRLRNDGMPMQWTWKPTKEDSQTPPDVANETRKWLRQWLDVFTRYVRGDIPDGWEGELMLRINGRGSKDLLELYKAKVGLTR